ncbi:retroviral-like aspartic protease family protein [Microcoleus sp. FACHB-1515]|uniref:retropepsin-like aspartic protease family protein n=1 Tax=Cyanophyceae TaxID=3028117 RepID=UPI0016877E8B|nr:retropepsin-like aspartic protease [Microcoleus sp. FACHB-1515]MBD2089341.1 retroviral-like aspartic protease family protein [Microcoleus sp. FACHB-1515]
MRQFSLRAVVLTGFALCGCSTSVTPPAPPAPVASPVAAIAPTPAPAAPTPTAPDPFQQGLRRAMSAATMAQAAQSQDDWRLVVSRWQQAIDQMKAIPAGNPRRAQAQTKVAEYQRNLAYAQRQANRSTALQNPDGVVRVTADIIPVAAPAPEPAIAPAPANTIFRAPILRRVGGIPVIAVTFNGTQQYEMIVDTGASGTLITANMAAALNVVPVGQATASTASARNVIFPLGYVQSVEVDGAIASDMLVAVAGPELDIGLLGHDFFGNFDVLIRQDVVEFHPR